MSERDEVLAANAAFYDAFARGDLPSMAQVWSESDAIACIHPGWPALHGREAVLASWERLLRNDDTNGIGCAHERIYLLGEAAFVICNEQLDGGELIATNVFAREDGTWRLVHHQAGPTPPPLDEPDDVIH